MQNSQRLGPIGTGWVREVKTKRKTRFVAYWNAYELRDGEVKRVTAGPYLLGDLDKHSEEGIRSKAQAETRWRKTYQNVFIQIYGPNVFAKNNSAGPKTSLTAQSNAVDLIADYERRRSSEWEENTAREWKYYRDNFLNPFFQSYTIAEMNEEEAVKHFMREIASRHFGMDVAKHCFTFVKALLDIATNLGITRGNAAKLIPKEQRYPKGIKRKKPQPAINIDQFLDLLEQIKVPRDRLILKLLFFCALRRSELLVLKWKDRETGVSGIPLFHVQRSFCSRTHKVKEWPDDDNDQNIDEVTGENHKRSMKAKGYVVIPPDLLADLEGWAKHGVTNPSDVESYIFPTRNGTAIIPTNWIEDVLKPAGAKSGIPDVTPHWFRRGHATQRHYEDAPDKSIQGQMRHSKMETTQNVYMQNVSKSDYESVVTFEKSVQYRIEMRKKKTA